ncbi:MAG TPA: hypothetical protein VIG38_16405, partial [Hyphomicrobium sp.]
MVTKNQVTSSREEMIRALLDDKFAAASELGEREYDCFELVSGRSKRGALMHESWREDTSKARVRRTLYLETLSNPELAELVQKMNSEVAQRTPHEERLFFNEPFADAQYYHWALMPCWSLEEATALLLGKDPDVVDLLALKHLHGSSQFAARFVTLLHRLQEAKEQAELDEYVSAEQLLDWAKRRQVEVPARMSKSINKSIKMYSAVGEAEKATLWETVQDAKTPSERPPTPHEKTAWARVRRSQEKMIIAMA